MRRTLSMGRVEAVPVPLRVVEQHKLREPAPRGQLDTGDPPRHWGHKRDARRLPQPHQGLSLGDTRILLDEQLDA